MAKYKVRYVKFTPEEMAYDIPAELDFSKIRHIPGGLEGMRRDAAARRAKRVVELAPDVAKLFPTADAVNAALRQFAQVREIVKAKAKKSA